jgi:hypothetical protein
MAVLQTLFAHGDELAFIAGRAAAFGEPVNWGIPQDILFPVHDPLDIGLEIVVFVDGHRLFEFAKRKDPRKIVFTPELRVLCGGNQVLQDFALHGYGIMHPMFDAAQAKSGKS